VAECAPDTPAIPRNPLHHTLVQQGVELIATEERSVGGGLGRPSSARRRVYERLMRYADQVRGTVLDRQDLHRTIEEIYRYPLRAAAVDQLNRTLRSGVGDEELVQLVIALRDDDQLCLMHEESETREPQIICSLGLFAKETRLV
jgi:hypothetical protein